MDKEIATTVTFEENCEYQSSTISKEIPIPKQEVTIQLENPVNTEANRNNHFYYDDMIKLQAVVFQTYLDTNNEEQKTFIQTGRVNFYFQEDGEEAQLINASSEEITCQLNQNGSAGVYFKPTGSGQVWAEYIDDNDFYIATNLSNKKDLYIEEIPVDIEFCNLPPYIADIHDEVNIKVHVTNALDGSDIRFGTVTFLHYLEKNVDINNPNKRVPDVIGNPAPVFDGYAEINYIPVQTDDDTEPEILIEDGEARYIEYIRASYNYSGKYIDTEKGAFKWKFFGTVSKWTGINVLARNSITINPLSLPLDGETGIYQCYNNETITFTAILKDKDDNQIFFDNHDGNLIFHLKGTHAHPKNPTPDKEYIDDYDQTIDEFNFQEYEKDIIATYSNGQFTGQISNLLPGYYTITATTMIQTDEGEILIDYGSVEDNITNSKKYAPVNESNILYLKSNLQNVTPNITLKHDTKFVETNTTLNNLTGEVTKLTNTQKKSLNNETCYFFIPKLNKTYSGILSYSSSKLIGTPSEDIIFTIAGNYEIYMYIPAKVYTSKKTSATYHSTSVVDFALANNMSSSITIEARDQIHLSLSVEPVEPSIPATFAYTCSSTGISTQASVQIITRLTTQSTTEVADEMLLFNQAPMHKQNIYFDTPGTYEVYAKANDVESNIVTIKVEKDTLAQELLESSLNIFASVNNTITVALQCSRENVDLINHNKIHAYLYDNAMSNQQTVTIESIERANSSTLRLVIKPLIWKEDEWYIKITYDGDSKIVKYTGKMEKFTSFLDTPEIQLIPHNDNYDVNIVSNNTSASSQYIITRVIFYDKNDNNVGEGIYITDGTKRGSLLDSRNNYNVSWWSEWVSVTFVFNPYDAELIQLLKNNTTPYNKLKTQYGYVFDKNKITSGQSLYQQLTLNNNKYIFDTYKSINVKVARPSSW